MKFYAFWFDFCGDYLEYDPLFTEENAALYAENYSSKRVFVMGIEV